MTGISAILITKDEERNIDDCLASLVFAEEIIVVDSGSTDRTEEICRRDPRVRWYPEEWKGFGRQKNSALDKAQSEWVFSIDADERVTGELAKEICSLNLAATREDAFRVPRRSYFGGKWVRHCGWYPDYTVRLFRKDRCRFNDREVHESVLVPGVTGTLKGDLLHYTYRDTTDFVERINRYSTLGARELRRQGKRVSILDLVVRPTFTFFKMLVIKRGFLDGTLGWRLAGLYSMYTFLKYVKAWEAADE